MRFAALTFPSDRPLAVDWARPLRGSWGLCSCLLITHVMTAFLVAGSWQALFVERTPLFRAQIGGQVSSLVTQGEWWRLVSSIGVHVDGLHLVFNIIAILGLGRLLEPWIGTKRLLAWFCIGGLLGSLSSFFAGVALSDGASGGAFALLGALVAMSFDSSLDLEEEAGWLLRGPVRWLAAVNLFLPLLLPFLDGVGHLGGFVCGIGLVLASRRSGIAAMALDLVGITVVGIGLLWALVALLT